MIGRAVGTYPVTLADAIATGTVAGLSQAEVLIGISIAVIIFIIAHLSRWTNLALALGSPAARTITIVDTALNSWHTRTNI
ncbi:hypothetical protein CO046_00680 [Candidatus Peregrinibacteria bacterium CG_4_9_14_0_2_um_filter_53_11]|nr:MAG: hypothetical protein CO046_00680 [Candidatus Peregrinibacteria bacterium CG_4_9_14_0_2_um_filter_53_11]